jgi:hypothetical protein
MPIGRVFRFVSIWLVAAEVADRGQVFVVGNFDCYHVVVSLSASRFWH